MVEPTHPRLSVVRQCELLGISRSSFYYEPIGESAINLKLMRMIDEQFLETPFFGSRQMMKWLRRQELRVCRKRIARLMRKMRLSAIFQKPNTSKPFPGHKIYPYLLKGMAIDAPNKVWCADVCCIPMRRGFLYLVASMDWYSRKVLSWRLSNTLEADFCVAALREVLAGSEPRDLQHGPRVPVHVPGVYRDIEGGRRSDLDGRQGPVDGQRQDRGAVAAPQIRVRRSACVRDRERGEGRHRDMGQLLQPAAAAFESLRPNAPRGIMAIQRRRHSGSRRPAGGGVNPRTVYPKFFEKLSKHWGPPLRADRHSLNIFG